MRQYRYYGAEWMRWPSRGRWFIMRFMMWRTLHYFEACVRPQNMAPRWQQCDLLPVVPKKRGDLPRQMRIQNICFIMSPWHFPWEWLFSTYSSGEIALMAHSRPTNHENIKPEFVGHDKCHISWCFIKVMILTRAVIFQLAGSERYLMKYFNKMK